MDSIHQAKVKSGHLLHKIALVQSQRNSTVCRLHGDFSSRLLSGLLVDEFQTKELCKVECAAFDIFPNSIS